MIGDRKIVFTDSGGLGMKTELDPLQVNRRFPEHWVLKSDKRGQEALDNHKFDTNKECYFGRPNKRG